MALAVGASPSPSPLAAENAAAARARHEMAEMDRAFSRASGARDRPGFLALVHPDAVFLAQGAPIARGRAVVGERWSPMLTPGGPQLTWEPYLSEANGAGDLGYTVGRFEWVEKGNDGQPVVERGEYISLWTRGGDGSWTTIVDSSKPALPPPAGFRAVETVAQGGSGDMRYRVERAPASASAPEQRRVVVERKAPGGTWATAMEVFTTGSAVSASPRP